MTLPSDMVVFEMPDGTLVSNDPRFDMAMAHEEQLASHEYTGDAGVPQEEFDAQHQVKHMAELQGNEVEDPSKLIPNVGTPAMQIQVEDLAIARDAGADLTNTSVEDAEPVDSNAAVAAVREATAKQREALQKAQEKLGTEDAGDPNVPMSDWTAAQLRLEVARRNADESRAEEDLIDTSGVKKKSQLVALLEADDAKSQA
jgi:hypothetical protein